MGKLGDMAKKAKEMAKGHPDKADQAVDRAERTVDERTGDRYDARTDRAAESVRRSYGGDENRPR
ncbi:antitoxin [Streptomyces sp. TRM43335]|uniref:Antitoxin n=1 Tax=Streptomyces taklimakanensis TaxID=2569853 RepID=A0A6G2B9M0_9ACTN|nr:antitoxin [Streptomyces taklimakanensis]MTE18769.1 antitoxin [Streptomyces taklimakanensis]